MRLSSTHKKTNELIQREQSQQWAKAGLWPVFKPELPGRVQKLLALYEPAFPGACLRKHGLTAGSLHHSVWDGHNTTVCHMGCTAFAKLTWHPCVKQITESPRTHPL